MLNFVIGKKGGRPRSVCDEWTGKGEGECRLPVVLGREGSVRLLYEGCAFRRGPSPPLRDCHWA